MTAPATPPAAAGTGRDANLLERPCPGDSDLDRSDRQVYRWCVALLILPIGLALGFILGRARLAAGITLVIGASAVVAYWVSGFEVSPIESAILLVGTPIAMWLAKWAAERRRD